MSSLITNIRKASAPLTESSAHLGRLLLQLGQAADSTLDAETLAELDKQATLAACQAIEAANAKKAAAGEKPEEVSAADGDGTGTETDTGTAGGAAAAEEGPAEGGIHEESSTATTVELFSADSSRHAATTAAADIGSNNSSSHHPRQPSTPADDPAAAPAAAAIPTSSSTTTPRSLMQASSFHSTTSSHAAPSPSSSLHGPQNAGAGAPSTLPSDPEAAPATPGAERKSSADMPVTVVLQGFDTEGDDKLVVCESRAVAHLFTRIRNRDTPPQTFRFYASRMMRILAEEVR